MIIPTHFSVRGLFVTSMILIGVAISSILMNSKTKEEYGYKVGIIEYLDDEYENHQTRHKEGFRYLVIDSYQYPFKIYLPNEIKSPKNLDDLKLGDEVKVYYYERKHTHEAKINNFAQFVDKGQTPYFIRGTFQNNLGYWIVGLAISLNLFSYFLWKRNNLKW